MVLGRQQDLDNLFPPPPLPPPPYITDPCSSLCSIRGEAFPLQPGIMDSGIMVVLALVTAATASPAVTIGPEAASTDGPTRPDAAQRLIYGQQNTVLAEKALEDVMATGELNPKHYPAQRAAKLVQHYLNARHGSPYRLFMLHSVHSGHAEDVANVGRKYQLEISMQDLLTNLTEKRPVEVLFPSGGSPEVQASFEELLKANTTAQEDALYQQYRTNTNLLSVKNLPDSHGHMDPDMKPFWHLGIVAASTVMLKESSEYTLYNVAQVANVTQLDTENDQLKFDCDVLLHDMVSQEIPHWKLLFSWSPSEGVKVLQMEQLPRCHCEKPASTS